MNPSLIKLTLAASFPSKGCGMGITDKIAGRGQCNRKGYVGTIVIRMKMPRFIGGRLMIIILLRFVRNHQLIH